MAGPIDLLLERLEGVREQRRGQWIARCPAHDDRRPSLLLDVGDDHRVLLFCYAGCGAAEITAAVGLGLADLFDCPRTDHTASGHPRRRPNLSARDVLEALDHERLIVAAVASDLLAGRAPTHDDMARLADAGRRIQRLREITR